jgi:hypothetical protein
MSEFARAVIEYPTAPERREAEREANKLFKKKASEMGRALARDQRLTPIQRLVGLELVAGLNAKVGYAWPSQETIAQKIGCSKRTVQRATDLLADSETGLWFRRELDGANYCYFPRFERLKEPLPPVDNRRHLRNATGDIPGVANVTLYSLRDSLEKETLSEPCGEPIALPPDRRKSTGRMDDRRKVFDLSNLDETITTAAQAEGNRAFVFLDSQPWRLWNEYRIGQGLPPLRPRQHQMNGLLRAGADLPTLYPPGYGRHCSPRNGR